MMRLSQKEAGAYYTPDTVVFKPYAVGRARGCRPSCWIHPGGDGAFRCCMPKTASALSGMREPRLWP